MKTLRSMCVLASRGALSLESPLARQAMFPGPALRARRNRIEAVAAPGSAAGQPTRGQPASTDRAMCGDGLRGVVGTRRRESAGAGGEVRRDDHLIRADRGEERCGGEAGADWPKRCVWI